MEVLLEWQQYGGTRPDVSGNEFREKVLDAYAPDFEMVEPPSLPYGGVYTGRDEFVAMRAALAADWALGVTDLHIWDLPAENVIVKYAMMEFTAHRTGRTATIPSVQVIWFENERMKRVEVFMLDSGVLLETLAGDEKAPEE
jgi:hypothetical protein